MPDQQSRQCPAKSFREGRFVEQRSGRQRMLFAWDERDSSQQGWRRVIVSALRFDELVIENPIVNQACHGCAADAREVMWGGIEIRTRPPASPSPPPARCCAASGLLLLWLLCCAAARDEGTKQRRPAAAGTP